MGMKKDLYPHGSRELVDPKCITSADQTSPFANHRGARSRRDFHTGVTDKPMTRKLKFGESRRLRGSEGN